MTEMQQQDIKAQWQNATLMLGAIVSFVIYAFYDTAKSLAVTWWDKPEYNHCLLILPIIAYLIHERREVFQKIAPKPSLWGLFPIMAGSALWLLGDLADANVVRQFGLIIIFQGCILSITGIRVARAFLFPLFYMVFLIPFGDFLVPYLQDYTTAFVIMTLNLMDIPVFVEGVYLSIPAGDFHVAEACAGLRFLVATVALGTLMANVAYKTVGRQISVVLLSFFVPVLANGFRASGIVLIAHWSDMKYATGVDHIVFGWIFFAVVLLIFISIAMTFTNRGLNDGYIDFSKRYWTTNVAVPVKTFALFLVMAIILVGIAPYTVSNIEKRYAENENNLLVLNEDIWGKNNEEMARWKPFYNGTTQTFHLQRTSDFQSPVDIFVGYYNYQSKEKEMIRFGNGVDQQDQWNRVESRISNVLIGDIHRNVNEMIIQSHNVKRLVWYWYWVDGKNIANNYKAKFFDAKAKLLGGRMDSGVIALSVEFDSENIEQKRQYLSNIAAKLPSLENNVTTSE